MLKVGPWKIQVLDMEQLTLTEEQRAHIRATMIGFVFQTFQLIPTLTAVENVLVPVELAGAGGRGASLRNDSESSERFGQEDP